MKKKILAIAIAAIMVVTALASISLAYLMDTDEDTNVFTVGNISIVQNEQQRDKTQTVTNTSILWDYNETKLVDFKEGQQIVPAVYGEQQPKEAVDVNGYSINIRNEGVQNYVDKIVTVTNTGNTNAFVRTFIAVPYNKTVSDASEAAGLDQSKEWLHWNFVTASDSTNASGKDAGWYIGKDINHEYPDAADYNSFEMLINSKPYLVTVFTNMNILTPDETTAPCMTGFYLDKDVCIEVLNGNYNYYITIKGEKYNLGDISNLEIYCATQAVQADGFTDAFTALDAAFGVVSPTNNPFYKPVSND